MTQPDKRLLVLLHGEHIGDLTQDRHGHLAFTYKEDWRGNPHATPLSLSMPLARRQHPNRLVDTYLRGLLPDNDNVLTRWGVRFGVSPNSPFALLSHVGEDVAGAAQFVREDRLADASGPGALQSVDEDYIANRLRVLRGDRAAWDDSASPGLFSLAGAQAKFALYRGPDGNWAIPTGRTATTHILKPPLEHLAHQEVNEHVCLRAAARLGMRTAHSKVMTFGDEHAIVLERYDRITDADGAVRRIHQEDMCQAMAVHPARKYERSEHGPGALRMIELLQNYQDGPTARGSAEQIVRALAFNWVVYGPDAHAKNHSLLLAGDTVALAPLYDISSVVPYPDRYDLRTMMMAMSVNGQFQNALITGDDWVALARAARLDPTDVLDWVSDVVDHAPDAYTDVVADQERWIRRLPMTKALVEGVAQASRERRRFLEPSTPTRSRSEPKRRRAARPTAVAPYQRKDGSWVSGYQRTAGRDPRRTRTPNSVTSARKDQRQRSGSERVGTEAVEHPQHSLASAEPHRRVAHTELNEIGPRRPRRQRRAEHRRGVRPG